MMEAGYEYDMTEADYVKAVEMEEGGPAVEGTTPSEFPSPHHPRDH